MLGVTDQDVRPSTNNQRIKWHTSKLQTSTSWPRARCLSVDATFFVLTLPSERTKNTLWHIIDNVNKIKTPPSNLGGAYENRNAGLDKLDPLFLDHFIITVPRMVIRGHNIYSQSSIRWRRSRRPQQSYDKAVKALSNLLTNDAPSVCWYMLCPLQSRFPICISTILFQKIQYIHFVVK